MGGLPENPPGAKPGQCWIPIYSPATYKEVTENVVKRAAAEKIELIPARYEYVPEQVLVKPASTITETIPAVYGNRRGENCYPSCRYKIEQVPAVYETVEEKVIDKEARTEWKKIPPTGNYVFSRNSPTYKL